MAIAILAISIGGGLLFRIHFNGRIRTGNPFNPQSLKQAGSVLSDEIISVSFESIDSHNLKMSVTQLSGESQQDTWAFSICAFLILEKEIGKKEQIDIFGRDTWKPYFGWVDKEGLLDRFKTPLILASGKGDFASLKRILESGCDNVNAQSPTGATALMYAALGGYTEIIQLLLDCGASVDMSGGEFTPLQAGLKGGSETIRLLISAGALVNAQNKYGETPLMHAVLWGNIDNVKLLLENGADPRIRDNDGRQCIDFVSESTFPEIFILLRNLCQIDGNQETQ